MSRPFSPSSGSVLQSCYPRWIFPHQCQQGYGQSRNGLLMWLFNLVHLIFLHCACTRLLWFSLGSGGPNFDEFILFCLLIQILMWGDELLGCLLALIVLIIISRMLLQGDTWLFMALLHQHTKYTLFIYWFFLMHLVEDGDMSVLLVGFRF